ncbi:MAG: shikimate kinase [Vicingaceae bacterium]
MTYPIYLMGFMASGKTSLGKKLARRLEVQCIDLDDYIEKKSGQSISTLFEKRGEASFRKLEAEALKEVSTSKAVISLGGGTVCQEGNLELIKASGTSFYLKVSAEVLIGRLKSQKSSRPLVAELESNELSEFVRTKLAEREAFYAKADFIIEKDKAVPNDLLPYLT